MTPRGRSYDHGARANSETRQYRDYRFQNGCDMTGSRLRLLPAAVLIALLPCAPIDAQNPSQDTTRIQPDTAEHWGAIDPGRGFTVAKTDRGTLALSLYILWRYLNQLPVQQTYFDHLGNPQRVNTRNDLQLHRI